MIQEVPVQQATILVQWYAVTGLHHACLSGRLVEASGHLVTPTRRQFYCDWSQMPSTGTMAETLCPQWNECAEVSLRKGILFITRS